MDNWYNDNDPKICKWLGELIRQGHLPAGSIHCKSIKEIKPEEVPKGVNAHFFAGIGGWPLALKMAGWPEDVQVWTGSCPCQPFSSTGKQQGEKDERHLWPDFRNLIEHHRPTSIFGEQVASKLGREWLSRVRADLEALGYVVGCADLCAAGINAPHIRQRLFWMAYSAHKRPHENSKTKVEEGSTEQRPKLHGELQIGTSRCGPVGRLADPQCNQLQRWSGSGGEPGPARSDEGQAQEREWGWDHFGGCCSVDCGDGKTRRIAPGLTTLAHGIPARVVRLRGYGNAIVPQLAAVFIRSAMEALSDLTNKPSL